MTKLDIAKIRAKLDSIADGFTGKVANVGFFESAQYPDGTPVAYVAAIQEFGAPEVGIPPRPFMRPTAEAQGPAWAKSIENGMRAVVKGTKTAEDVLERAGRLAAVDIKNAISTMTTPPLQQSTIDARIRRKTKGKNPVIGRLKQADENGKFAKVRLADLQSGRVQASEVSGLTQPLVDTGALVAHVQSAVGDAE